MVATKKPKQKTNLSRSTCERNRFHITISHKKTATFKGQHFHRALEQLHIEIKEERAGKNEDRKEV